MSEFELIGRYFTRAARDPAVRIGVGDDAAVVRPAAGNDLVISVDMLVEGRHFLADVDPAALGHKTLAVNLSDLSAMGATPRWALLAGALPDNDERWIGAFAAGLFALAGRFDVELIGGDTTRGPRNFCVTIIGEVPQGTAMTRSGAQADDDVYVSGTLGDAALALAALQHRADVASEPLRALRARLDTPEPRVGLGQRLRGVASAALDVSDGLVGDLGHILAASKVGAAIELAAIPVSPELARRLATGERDLALYCALAGGDDYELCFTAPTAARDAIADIARATALSLARIGTITRATGLVVLDEHAIPLPALPRAFDHFA